MRLLIADDHDLLRDTLCRFLEQQKDIEITAVADSAQALALIESAAAFDLVLLDYGMPGMEALAGLRAILALPDAPAVALMSGVAPREIVLMAFEMGVRGYLHKSMPALSLLHAIRFMALGERFAPVDFMLDISGRGPEPASLRSAPSMPGAASGSLAEALTPRERDVLAALCRGCTNKEIARDLGLSLPTIKLHVKTLYRRLGVSNRTQAAMVAQARDWR